CVGRRRNGLGRISYSYILFGDTAIEPAGCVWRAGADVCGRRERVRHSAVPWERHRQHDLEPDLRPVRRHPEFPRGRSTGGHPAGRRGRADVHGERDCRPTSERGGMTVPRSARLATKLDTLASSAVWVMIVATVIFLLLPIAVTVVMAMDSRQ